MAWDVTKSYKKWHIFIQIDKELLCILGVAPALGDAILVNAPEHLHLIGHKLDSVVH